MAAADVGARAQGRVGLAVTFSLGRLKANLAAKDLDYDRLCTSLRHSRLELQKHRKQHYHVARELAGERYSENAAEKTVYVNLISLYVNIVGRTLVSNNPQSMLTVYEQASQATASACEQWENEELLRMDASGTFKRIAQSAMIDMGVGLVGLATPADAARFPWRLSPGEPFMSYVNPDDFVYECGVRDISEAGYQGHRYRAVKEAILDSKLYSKEGRERLAQSTNIRYNAEGDPRIGSIGTSYYSLDGEFEDMVDLWDVYLPRHGCMVTLTDEDFMGPSAQRRGGRMVPLRYADWVGHPSGPYEILRYGHVEGNAYPVGPLLHIFDLHVLMNQLMRKLARQSALYKRNTLVMKGNAEDNKRYQESADGDMLPVDDPKSFSMVESGGVNQELFLFTKEVFNLFSMAAGNLMTLGGLAPQSGTATQEKLLAAQSSAQVAEMQDMTTKFVSSMFEKLHWYWWNNPDKIMRTKFEVDGLPEFSMMREVFPAGAADQYQNGQRYSPLKREGEMPRIKTNPYTMRNWTPQEKADAIMQIVTQAYIPMAQFAQEAGITLDFAEFMRGQAKFRDLPELKRILSIQEAKEEDAGHSARGPSKPPETKRTYERISSGDSYQANQESMNALLEAGAKRNGQMQ